MEFSDGTTLCDLCSRVLVSRPVLGGAKLDIDLPSPYSPDPDHTIRRNVCLHCRQALYNQNWLYFPKPNKTEVA